jgi:hypothetical protein
MIVLVCIFYKFGSSLDESIHIMRIRNNYYMVIKNYEERTPNYNHNTAFAGN